MPENPIPVTKTEPGAAAGEFNFAQPEKENPRIKRRSLKTKPAGLIKPTAAALPPAARELAREAPPLSAEEATKIAAQQAEAAKVVSTTKAAPIAPPRTTPATSAPASSTPKTTTQPTTPSATTTTASTSTAGPASSPHGTRPATLYYSSNTRKAETPSPMKTIPTASTASSSSSSAATAVPTSVTRPTTASASRPAPTVDYRANIERQSREQKSVGSILSYVVYALIAFFVLSAALAGYGAKVIFSQLHDQSVTVADLDQKYAAANKDLVAKLSATQDTLTEAQAQIARQQDLIVKQQETLNQLLTASTANDAAIKQEKQARQQETQTRTQDEASLRARIKDIEYRTSIQKY